MALLQNGQGVEQLTPKIGAAAAVERQSGEGGDHGEAAGVGSETGLDAPQSDDETGLHAEFLGHPLEQFPVFAIDPAAFGGQLRGDPPSHIFLEGLGDFGLLPVELDDTGNRRNPVERRVEQRRPDPLGERFRAKIHQPGRKIGVVGGSRRFGLMGEGRADDEGQLRDQLDQNGRQDRGCFQGHMARHANPFDEAGFGGR